MVFCCTLLAHVLAARAPRLQTSGQQAQLQCGTGKRVKRHLKQKKTESKFLDVARPGVRRRDRREETESRPEPPSARQR